jgi:transposase-like protein
LPAATITRLTEQWKDDARAFAARSLAEVDYAYVWVDGLHLKVRLEQDKVCLLVMIGVRADGTKELVALSDGFRESSESWADLLRDCKRRGMTAPVLAVGDGALGFWKAIRDVFPDTKEQRCWWHKIGNVLAALPKSAHPAAKKALAEIYNAENRGAIAAPAEPTNGAAARKPARRRLSGGCESTATFAQAVALASVSRVRAHNAPKWVKMRGKATRRRWAHLNVDVARRRGYRASWR